MNIDTRHGVALVEQAIAILDPEPERLRDFCGWHVLKQPAPLLADVLATLTFPSGRPLPPSLRRWLAFDASWLADLGWFNETRTEFTPRSLAEIVAEEYDYTVTRLRKQADVDMMLEPWRRVSGDLPECFLLPDGADSRRVYAVTEPDEYGEYPVLVTDNDDGDYLAVMYPGFDVYLAERVGALDLSWDSYTALSEHEDYRGRMRTHAARAPFHGDVTGLDLWYLDD